jgi:hypothetical protein
MSYGRILPLLTGSARKLMTLRKVKSFNPECSNHLEDKLELRLLGGL